MLVFLLFPFISLAAPFFSKQASFHLEGGTWVSEWVEVQVPKNLQSMQVLAVGSPEVLLQVTDLVDPDGLKYVQSTVDGKLTIYSQPVLRNVLSSNRSEAVSYGTGTLIVPNSPDLPFPKEGIWKIRLLSHHKPLRDTADIYFFGKSDKKTTLNAKIWLAPESNWPQETVDKMIGGVKKIYSDLGIQIQFQKTEPVSETFSKPLELPKDISALAWKMNDPAVMNIYLMPAMQFQNKPVNGLACLGGPSNISIQHSCFVSMYANGEAQTVSDLEKTRILAHEIGHYLGLFHTRDDGYYLINTMNDPLSDTPFTVTGTNMMDPGVHEKNPSFSVQQKKFLLLSPALE